LKNKKLENERFLSIDFLYAFVVTEGADEGKGEGVLGFMTKTGMSPMIGADMERVESLKPIADDIAKQAGVKYEIRKFKRIE